MRFALLSDIHANAEALSAVLDDIKENRVDQIICLGDIATLGPSPKEVIKTIQDLNCLCILGNHEQALNTPEKCLDYNIPESLKSTLYWTLDQLTQDDLNFLNNFHPSAIIELTKTKSMLCYHGSPTSSIGSITPTTSEDELEKLFYFDKKIALAIGGHIHTQMLRKHRGMIIANTGSVGFSFHTQPKLDTVPTLSPFAEYAIVESKEDAVSVELKQIAFDHKAYLSTLGSSSSPLKTWLQEQYTDI